VDLINQWQAGFFNSSFTHPGGAVRLTKHAGGFVGLWSSLVDSGKPFPVEYLTDARQTLKQFVEAADHQ
jgi:hypothetical protein